MLSCARAPEPVRADEIMDAEVLRAVARWPQVPAVYGWLALDRRGDWRMRDPGRETFGRIGNAALRAFIARNYAADARGCWYFQNGPQRVYVTLAYTPFVLRYAGESLVDQCGAPLTPRETFVDEEGGSFYRVRVRTAAGLTGASGETLPVMPGMVAEVDILTGRRTVLDYLLRPLLRAQGLALSER